MDRQRTRGGFLDGGRGRHRFTLQHARRGSDRKCQAALQRDIQVRTASSRMPIKCFQLRSEVFELSERCSRGSASLVLDQHECHSKMTLRNRKIRRTPALDLYKLVDRNLPPTTIECDPTL